MNTVSRRLVLLLAVAAAIGARPSVAAAHPLHTAVAELRLAPDGLLTLKVRTFSDDFSAAVARATHTNVLADHQVSDEAASRYVRAALTLQVAGAPVALRLVAQHRDGDVTWLELRTERPLATLRGARLLNRMLMEYHADQVNVIKAYYDGRSFTTLFSAGEGPKALP